MTTSTQERDIHSYARPHEVRVTHVALDLTADFDARVLSGTATLSLQRNGSASEVVLDTKGLDIQRVAAGRHRAEVRIRDRGQDPWPGVDRGAAAGATEITVTYRTSPDAAALQWLQPSQTAGGKHPYLYSQGEAIFTRTWIPTQDTPGVRQTYSARITVPRDLRAVMSAEQLTPRGRGGRRRTGVRVPPHAAGAAVSHRHRRW